MLSVNPLTDSWFPDGKSSDYFDNNPNKQHGWKRLISPSSQTRRGDLDVPTTLSIIPLFSSAQNDLQNHSFPVFTQAIRAEHR